MQVKCVLDATIYEIFEVRSSVTSKEKEKIPVNRTITYVNEVQLPLPFFFMMTRETRSRYSLGAHGVKLPFFNLNVNEVHNAEDLRNI